MAYNYGGPPGAYNYGYNAPPGTGMPPGMNAPPGMQSQSPAGQQSFQPPPNMPNINFSAPVIRLGLQDQQKSGSPADRLTSGQGRGDGRGSNAEPLGRRAGLGSQNRMNGEMGGRDDTRSFVPPTREEVARTIFVGGLTDTAPNDMQIERLLQCAGRLRHWTRAHDADEKLCKFGFAEYEDVESLEAASEILVGLEVPQMKNGSVIKEEESEEVKYMKLLVVVDDQSKKYIEEWKGRGKEDDNARQFRIDGCKEDLRQSIISLANQGAHTANGMNGAQDGEDTMMNDANGENAGGENAEVVTIPLTLEDELSDVPAEMRAEVAQSIRAFRERSNMRDRERAKREEELEQAERQRSSRINRLASPPPSAAPTGPASASNGIPVGPRDRTNGVQGAPAGPRGYRGAQMPDDYVNGVNFVGTNGVAYNPEDEDAEESDEELERRRRKKQEDEVDKQFQEAEANWLKRESRIAAAQERQKQGEEREARRHEREREELERKLREWDDDEEARRGDEEYYRDRSAWLRKRDAHRAREARFDDKDREEEARENAEEQRKKAEAKGMADEFMESMGNELGALVDQQRPASRGGAPANSGFKMSLGSAAARTRAAQQATQAAVPNKRAMADVEGMLEDEDDAVASGTKRPRAELQTLPDTSASAAMTDSERADARAQLASEIPTSTEDLFAHPLNYSYLTSDLLATQIRPFIEKKVVEYLGVQEDLLVDAVVEGLENKTKPEEIVGVLEEALDEEAEQLVRKVWRLCVFWAECGARGLA